MSSFYDLIFQNKKGWNQEVLITNNQRYTILDLHQKVQYFISELEKNGDLRGKRVAVLIPNVAIYTALITAINKLGGIVVPLSVQYRKEDLTEILKLIEPHIIFTIEQYQSIPFLSIIKQWCESQEMETIVFTQIMDDKFEKSINSGGQRPLESQTNLDVILCTSGSTGVPKGIMFTVDGLYRGSLALKSPFQLAEGDSIFGTIPISATYGFHWLLITLTNRLPIVVPEGFDLPNVIDLLKKNQCNKFTTTPSLFKTILMFVKKQDPTILENIELCGLVGEKVPEGYETVYSDMVHTLFVNIYGMSEQGMIMHNGNLRNNETDWNICEDVSFSISESEGGIGELITKTPSRFLGYYKNSELTQEVLADDGWFHTGDLVKFNHQNRLQIVARKKEMIKKAGQQVIPGEIEYVLNKHPKIKQSAVIGIPHHLFGEQAIAFIATDEKIETKEVYQYMKELLASYKIPEQVISIDEFPIVQGKIDKVTLKKYIVEHAGV